MQFGINTKHIDFFKEKNYIEFENLFSQEQIDEIKKAIDQELEKCTSHLIETLSSKELFLHGRDLRLQNELIAKCAHSKHLGKIAAALFHEKILRIAYDQAFVTKDVPSPIFIESFPLQEISCFQPVIGAVLIRLSEESNPGCDLLPKKTGSALFFSSKFPFPWSALTQDNNQTFLLLVYGPNKLMYVLEKRDPHTHLLKKSGYTFGDAVNNDTNRVVFIHK